MLHSVYNYNVIGNIDGQRSAECYLEHKHIDDIMLD